MYCFNIKVSLSTKEKVKKLSFMVRHLMTLSNLSFYAD